jgi:hypothetical protein
MVGYGVTEFGINSQRRSVTLPISAATPLTREFQQTTSGSCAGDGPLLAGPPGDERVAGMFATIQNGDGSASGGLRPDGTAGDGSVASTGDADTTGEPNGGDGADDGCGCRHRRGSRWWALGLPLAVVLRRRRR